MKRFRSRTAVTAVAAGGFATVAMFLAPAMASADPFDLAAPLLETDCTFAQVDAALHAEAPQMAAMLDQNPSIKAQFKQKFELTPEQRRAELEKAIAENPEAVQQGEENAQATNLRQTIEAVAATCKNY